jgi:hypothetical protein
MELELFSDLEGRIPFGAQQSLIVDLLRKHFRALDVMRKKARKLDLLDVPAEES